MCLGNNSTDQAKIEAQQTQQQMQADEDARQARIKAGQGSIGEAFKQFDDPYFQKYKNDYVASTTPDVNFQFDRAKDKATAALARNGTLNSSIAGNTFGDLTKTRDDALSQITNEAGDAANEFRTKVQGAKSNLYSMNTAAGDPNMIAAQASGQALSLVPPKATSGMGDLFGSVLSPLVGYTKASIYSPTGKGYSFFAPPTSGGGSGKVYG